MSIANAAEIGVMACAAVFSVNSNAPAMIVVSSCVNSPPFPACSSRMNWSKEDAEAPNCVVASTMKIVSDNQTKKEIS